MEKDPNGLNQHEPGAKLDDGKIEASLLKDFGLALMEIGKVLTYGRKKYSASGWTKVKDGYQRYSDAMWRHLLKSNYSETDEESGLMHDAQIAWNSLARLEMKLRERKNDVEWHGDVEQVNIKEAMDIYGEIKWKEREN